MGILNRLTGLLGGAKKGGIAEVVQALIEQFGSIDALVAKLKSSDLAGQLESWIGTGENSPAGASKIEGALGSDAIAGVAKKLGVDQKEAAAKISMALPKVIDRLTPAGNLPEGGISMEAVTNLLGRLQER
ncbi:MAG: YidB family protein [Acidimicrobiia bacterium]